MNRQRSHLTLDLSAKEAPRGNKSEITERWDIHLPAESGASSVDESVFVKQSFFALHFCQENSVNRVRKALAGGGEEERSRR